MEKCKCKNFMPLVWIFILTNTFLPLHSTLHNILYANVLPWCSFFPPLLGMCRIADATKVLQQITCQFNCPGNIHFFPSSQPLAHVFCFVLAVLILCSQCYKVALKSNDTKWKKKRPMVCNKDRTIVFHRMV